MLQINSRVQFSVLCLLAIALGCACDRTPSNCDDPNVVAAYRGGTVSRADFDGFERQDLEKDPQVVTQDERDWRIENIRQIALRQILVSEVSPDDPDPQLQNKIEQTKSEILVNAMRHELGWDQITVTPEEIRAHYDDNHDLYQDPEKLRMQHIYLRAEIGICPPDEREEIRNRLDALRQEILEGAEFAEMAKMHSNSGTARGGGWMTLEAGGDAFPSFVEAVWALEVGEVSEVIDTPTGFQLVKLADRIPQFDRKFEDVIKFAREQAEGVKLAALHREFIREAGPRHNLEMHFDRLSDPFLKEDEPLFTIAGRNFTFSNLTGILSDHHLGQLYTGYFPTIHKLLNDVVVNWLLAWEAQRIELMERPEVAAQIEAATTQFRWETAIMRRLIQNTSEMQESVLRAYYEQNEERYQTMITRDLDVILLKPEPEEALWHTLKRGEALVERIRAGEDFAELARKHSRHYSVSTGGRMERLTSFGISRLVRPRAKFTAVLNDLKDGDVTSAAVVECYEPERLRYRQVGVIIVRLVKTYPPEKMSFEDAIDKVRASYLRRHYMSIESEVNQAILDSVDLQIYTDHLPPI